jgi:hypothetical protein
MLEIYIDNQIKFADITPKEPLNRVKSSLNCVTIGSKDTGSNLTNLSVCLEKIMHLEL